MLQKNPADRFPTADDLVRALDGLKQGTVTKPPQTAQAPPPKRKAAMVALPIVGILLLGIVIGLVLRGSGPPPAAPVAKAPPEKVAPPPPAVPPKPDPKPEVKSEPPKPVDPAPPKPEPEPVKPLERILSGIKDATERRLSQEVMTRTEELLQAMQKKDLKTVRGILDELAFGQPTDQQLLELLNKNHAEQTLEY